MLSRAFHWLYRELFQELDLERKGALTALGWGAWVIAFNTFDSSPAYRYLIRSAQWLTGPDRAECFWGGLSIFAGALQLYGIFADRRRLRMGAALFAATLWTCLGAGFALNNPVGTGALVYGLFGLANGALYYQVGTGRRGARGRFNLRISIPGGERP